MSWASELARAILRSTLLTRASSASAIAIELIVVNGGVSRSGIEMEKKKIWRREESIGNEDCKSLNIR